MASPVPSPTVNEAVVIDTLDHALQPAVKANVSRQQHWLSSARAAPEAMLATDGLAASLEGMVSTDPAVLNSMDLCTVAGIVPVSGEMAQLYEPFLQGGKGRPATAARIYGDIESELDHEFVGPLNTAMEPLTMMAPALYNLLNVSQRPTFFSPTQTCTFPVDFSSVIKEKEDLGTVLARTTFDHWEIAATKAARPYSYFANTSVSAKPRFSTSSTSASNTKSCRAHPAAMAAPMTANTRLLAAPMVWAGCVGMCLDLCRDSTLSTSLGERVFVPLPEYSYDELVRICRQGVVECLGKVQAALDTWVPAELEKKRPEIVVKHRDAVKKGTTTQKADDWIKSKLSDERSRLILTVLRDELYRRGMVLPGVITARVLDTSAWIPMTSATTTERCFKLASLWMLQIPHQVEVCKAVLNSASHVVGNRLSVQTGVLEGMVQTGDVNGVLQLAFKPTTPWQDTTSVSDVMNTVELVQATLTEWTLAEEILRALLCHYIARVIEPVSVRATQLQAMGSEQLPMPWFNPVVKVTSSTGSRFDHLAGVATRYDLRDRLTEMAPANIMTVKDAQGWIRLNPNITNRLHHLVSAVRRSNAAIVTGPVGQWLAQQVPALAQVAETVTKVSRSLYRTKTRDRQMALMADHITRVNAEAKRSRPSGASKSRSRASANSTPVPRDNENDDSQMMPPPELPKKKVKRVKKVKKVKKAEASSAEASEVPQVPQVPEPDEADLLDPAQGEDRTSDMEDDIEGSQASGGPIAELDFSFV